MKGENNKIPFHNPVLISFSQLFFYNLILLLIKFILK